MEKIFVTLYFKEVIGNLAKARSVGYKGYKIDCIVLSPECEVVYLLEITLLVCLYMRRKEKSGSTEKRSYKQEKV